MRDWACSVRGTRYWLVADPTDTTDPLTGRELADLLAQWAFDGHVGILQELAHHLGLGTGIRPTDDDGLALAERITSALDTRLPLAMLCREPAPQYALEPPPERIDIADILPELPPLPPEPGDHWIEVCLLDSGEQPIVNERFELVLPDGKVENGRTDDEGLLRVDPIFKAGNCRLYFPDLQAQLAGSL